MLNLALARTSRTLLSWPGWSGTAPLMRTILLALASSLSTSVVRRVRSMFPPDIKATTLFPLTSTLPLNIAAREAAPAPSASILLLSSNMNIARATSLSVTVTNSSTSSETSLYVSSPGFLVTSPSIRPGLASTLTGLPASRLLLILSA
ncbi:hypothetical protein D1872_260360 [compost metagenome]